MIEGGKMANNNSKNPLQYMMATGEFRDERSALAVLKASLQALRDRLPKVEAYRLGILLPENLRHSYFEGWHNGQRQAESLNKSDFLAEVEDHLRGFEEHSLGDLVPVALKSVLLMINGFEAEKLKDAIPKSMQDIFHDGQAME